MTRRVALVATAGLVAALVTAGRAPASAAPAGCTVLEVVDGTHLVARSLPADTATVVGRLREPVNAIGADGPLAYGLTDSGRVVTFDAAGHERDLGRPRGYGRIVHAVAGTIVGDRWYVLAGARLYVLDVGRRSPRIIDETELHPARLADQVDDFDGRDGVFYGVAQQDRQHGVVVRIDPRDGRVTPTHVVVPGGAGFGAASVGPDGALYARENDSHGRSTRYRIPLPAGRPMPLDSGPAVRTSDATNCLPTPPPPPPTTTTPPPTTTTEPPPPPTTTTTTPVPTTTPTTAPTTTPPAEPTTTTPAPTTTVVPAPVVLPPTTRAVVPPPTPAPTPRPTPAPAVPDDDPVATAAPQVTPAAVTERKQQRQFGLAALILIIGGAASTRIRPGRRSRSTQ